MVIAPNAEVKSLGFDARHHLRPNECMQCARSSIGHKTKYLLQKINCKISLICEMKKKPFNQTVFKGSFPSYHWKKIDINDIFYFPREYYDFHWKYKLSVKIKKILIISNIYRQIYFCADTFQDLTKELLNVRFPISKFFLLFRWVF